MVFHRNVHAPFIEGKIGKGGKHGAQNRVVAIDTLSQS